tara:strand:+ start:226 stop:1005 length:780 start_codon:yes stop_codon:yes gene_type:complete
MKKLLLLFSAAIIFVSCNSNPDYEKNLATAVSFFELHGVEDLDAQLELVSKEIESESSRYGSEMVGYDQFVEMLKGYHDAFDNIKYTAQNWLPGTNEEGQLDGSVRTYGTWTGTNVITGKELDLKGYWYMNFDDQGKIVAQGDFFDFGGMFNAVYPKNLVFIQVKVKNGKKQEMIDLLNSERGIPTTVAYDGAIGYDMAYNDETNILHLIGNWESYEKYDKYLNWRLNEDDFIKQMVPLMVGGESGLVVSQPNSNFQSF